MRFIAFFAFVATASATTKIFPSTHSNCNPQDVPPIDTCGDHVLLDYDGVKGGKIVYDGQEVTWYQSIDGFGCIGESASVDTSTDCYTPPFSPSCVRIDC